MCRYSGMMSTIEIRKAGYPHQHTFSEFRHRYQALGVQHPGQHANSTSDEAFTHGVCVKILGPASPASWQIGKSKVFFKDSHDTKMEHARENIMRDSVLHIQRIIRGAMARQRYQRMLWAIRTIRKHLQRHIAVRNFQQMQHGFQRLQSTIKTFTQRAIYLAYMKKLGREPTSQAPLLMPPGKTSGRAPTGRDSADSDDESASDFGFTDADFEEEPVVLTPEERLAALLKFETGQAKRRRESSEGLSERRKALQEKQAALDKEKRTARTETVGALAEQLETMPGIFGDVSSHTVDKLATSMFAADHSTFAPGSVVPTTTPLLKATYDGDENVASAVVVLISAMFGASAGDGTPQKSSSGKQSLDVSTLFPLKGNLPNASPATVTATATAAAGSATLGLSELEAELESSSMGLFDLQNCRTSLEKLRLLSRLGLVHDVVRDEVYSQLMMHILTKPKEELLAMLWIAMGACLGCFPPSNRFMKYLVHFLRDGPALHAVYCEDRLLQTISRGARRHPISWVELQAVKFRQPIRIAVTLVDGHTTAFLADSTSTVAEIQAQVYKKLSINDGVGYMLCLEATKRRFRLTGATGFIMDAVSIGEMATKVAEQGQASLQGKLEWALIMRREVFPPWYHPTFDVADLRLSYAQIAAGVKTGEYSFPSEKKLAKFAAKHYYVQYGPDLEYDRLRRMLPLWLPDAALATHKLDWWAKQIQTLHARGAYVAAKASTAKVQSVTVTDSMQMWRSKLSFAIPVTIIAGPQVFVGTSGTLCVNHDGVQFVDNSATEVMHIEYHYILSVQCIPGSGADEHGLDSLHIILPTSKLQFRGSNARAGADLLSAFHFELRRRSNFAIALSTSEAELLDNSGEGYVQFEKGDLLHVRRGFTAMQQTSAEAENLATGDVGIVGTKNILLLATVPRPTDEMLSLFRSSDVSTSSLQLDSQTTAAMEGRREVMVTGPLDINRDFRLRLNKPGKGVAILFIDGRTNIQGDLQPGDFITHINGEARHGLLHSSSAKQARRGCFSLAECSVRLYVRPMFLACNAAPAFIAKINHIFNLIPPWVAHRS